MLTTDMQCIFVKIFGHKGAPVTWQRISLLTSVDFLCDFYVMSLQYCLQIVFRIYVCRLLLEYKFEWLSDLFFYFLVFTEPDKCLDALWEHGCLNTLNEYGLKNYKKKTKQKSTVNIYKYIYCNENISRTDRQGMHNKFYHARYSIWKSHMMDCLVILTFLGQSI